MSSPTSLAAFILYTSILLCSGDNTANLGVHLYSYESRLGVPGNEALNRTMKGYVLLNTDVLNAHKKPSGAGGYGHRLLVQMVVDLGLSDPLKGLLIRDEWGLVERILLPSSCNSSDFRLNFFKAIAGIFNYHHTFAAGVEYDTSGRCQTYYAEAESVNKVEVNFDKVMIIDKQKAMCEPLGQPMDGGIWSISSILKDSRITHSWIRYHFERETGLLMIAKTYEQHRIAFALDTDVYGNNAINVEGMQTLRMLDRTSGEGKKISEKLTGFLATTKSSDLSTMAVELLRGPYRAEHLALAVPRQTTSKGCGIQSMAFEDDALNSPRVRLSLATLKEKVKDFAAAIKVPGRISSAHAALQLIRFLRCLPADQAAVQTVAEALEFIPSTRRELNLQLETGWLSILTDIVIDCGTELCLELVRQRLVKAIDLADFAKIGSAAPREVHPGRKYLLGFLWPSVAHISNPSLKILKELIAICYHSLPAVEKSIATEGNDSENPYTCLLTVSSILSRFRGNYFEEKHLLSKIEDTLIDFITFSNKAYEDNMLSRQKLLTAFASAEKIRSIRLFEALMSLAQNPQVPAVIRAVGVKTLGNLDFGMDKTVFATVVTKLMDFIESPTPGPYFDNGADELILKYRAFSILLNLELPAPEIARVLSSFGSNKKWSLLVSCRRLLDTWCTHELLTESACHCTRHGGLLRPDTGILAQPVRVCKPGLGAGWSGLADTITSGEVNLIYGDLLDNRPDFLSDYSLQWVTGPHGEIRTSNLAVSLVGADSEAKLMTFDIYGDRLASLMGKENNGGTPWLSVGFSFLHGTIPPRQVFSGGVTDILNLIFVVPDQPTPFFTATRLPMDVRRYIPSSSGWVLKFDLMGVSSTEISGALSFGILSPSGTALVRTRAAFVAESILTVVETVNQDQPLISMATGVGTAACFDFSVNAEITNLPESVCMHFQRSQIAKISHWTGKFEESPVLGKRKRPPYTLPQANEGYNEYYNLTQSFRIPPVSFFLGALNTARCRMYNVDT